MNSTKINIAVDGYSSCGKSTLAKLLAKDLGYVYIDSGAMYRSVTCFALENGLIKDHSIVENSIIQSLDDIRIEFQLNDKNEPEAYLNGENIEKQIRSVEVSRFVSQISAIKEVRRKMVAIQKRLGKNKGVVMDGRDIGSQVFPDAEIKLFMISDLKVRVKRRYEELKAKGENINLHWVEDNLKQRDHLDTTREESPLIQTPDAIVIDNTYLTLEELQQEVLQLVHQKIDEISVSKVQDSKSEVR